MSPLGVPHAYVAGKMRGVPEYNFPAFDECADYLVNHCGFIVFNPAARDRLAGFDPTGLTGNEDLAELGFSLTDAMRADLDWITTHGSMIVLLPGWSNSDGAKLELEVARVCGQDVYYYWPDNGLGWRLEEDPQPDDVIELANQKFPTIDVTENAQAIADILNPRCYGCPVHTDLDCIVNCDTITHVATDGAVDVHYGDIGDEDYAPDEVRITNAATGGQKNTKPERFDLLAVSALEEEARVYAFGAQKYEANNWRKGYDWSLAYSALQRHANAFWRGETHDPESGLHHLAHVRFHCASLIEWATTRPELDDRPFTSHEKHELAKQFAEAAREKDATVETRAVASESAKQLKENEAEACLRAEVEDAELDRYKSRRVYIEVPAWRSEISLSDWFRTDL